MANYEFVELVDSKSGYVTGLNLASISFYHYNPGVQETAELEGLQSSLSIGTDGGQRQFVGDAADYFFAVIRAHCLPTIGARPHYGDTRIQTLFQRIDTALDGAHLAVDLDEVLDGTDY